MWIAVLFADANGGSRNKMMLRGGHVLSIALDQESVVLGGVQVRHATLGDGGQEGQDGMHNEMRSKGLRERGREETERSKRVSFRWFWRWVVPLLVVQEC